MCIFAINELSQMSRLFNRPLICCLVILSGHAASPFSAGETLRIAFAGGQSNMLALRSDAAQLPFFGDDTSIAFYFHEGLKPSFGANAFISTSDSTWTFLQPQQQLPFIKGSEFYFGPEYLMARTLFSGGIDDLGVIKMAYGGTSISQDWMKGNSDGEGLYQIFLDEISIATDSLNSWGIRWEFIGMAWMQGETDASDAEWAQLYENNLKQFIRDVRSDLATPDLRVVLGEVAHTGYFPYSAEVRAAQAAVADSDTNILLIDSDDLSIGPDSVHWTTPGIMTLGRRMGEALLRSLTAVVDDNRHQSQPGFVLIGSYPNPFNPSTIITYTLAEEAQVDLGIYTLLGELVCTLYDDTQTAGLHSLPWTGQDAEGTLLPAGVYLARLKLGHKTQTAKLLLLQ